jgi:hypothetical protein
MKNSNKGFFFIYVLEHLFPRAQTNTSSFSLNNKIARQRDKRPWFHCLSPLALNFQIAMLISFSSQQKKSELNQH